ncbi:DUF4168 domain-containing protein [Tamlana haliotis]|uniref:DUF4168 domain-containing protein n=1 Tax=Pseudotamlana haliotis TaxID=2614804 RepID=A0A6N6MF12_9FLAO|nr:DUF4168 domain-containing protein [Tamlana haliotis]KAB1067924.1 DUF4168 domain-containing protein [Tamlana haliotis]
MRFSKKIKALIVCFLMMGGTMMAQSTAPQNVTVSDAELGKIASVFQGVQAINVKAQEGMMKTVQDNGFELDRFNEIYEAAQTGKSGTNLTDEEKEKFGEVMNALQQQRAGIQKQMETVITEEGLTLERYQEVAMALQSDTKLQVRLKAELAK